jgi:hypothetical protein
MPANQGWELGAVRTVFISDVHLGSRHAQGVALLQFLEEVRPESLYLVGDTLRPVPQPRLVPPPPWLRDQRLDRILAEATRFPQRTRRSTTHGARMDLACMFRPDPLDQPRL